MSVRGWTGYWGSGKSLMMCAQIRADLKRNPNALVFNNFGFKGPNAFDFTTVDELVAIACTPFDGREKIIAVDEIGMLLRARSAATWPPAADVVFLQGRKLHISLYWTAQHWRLVDVNVRRVTECVTECSGHLLKRVTPRGVYPKQTRPRLIRERAFMAPNPETGELPKEATRTRWHLWSWRNANSYETMRLVETAQVVLQQQQEQARQIPAVLAALELLSGARDGTGAPEQSS